MTNIIDTTAQPLTDSDPEFADRLGSGHADLAASTDYARSNPCPAEEDG